MGGNKVEVLGTEFELSAKGGLKLAGVIAFGGFFALLGVDVARGAYDWAAATLTGAADSAGVSNVKNKLGL